MKIATFNVNSVRARLPLVLDWLTRHRPDVLCLQETKVRDADFPVEPFAGAGYHLAFKGQKGYNGVAVCSTRPLENISFGFADNPYDRPRLVRASVAGITIVNTYVPQGYMPDSDRFEYKLRWFDRLADYFDANFKPTDLLLWVGDLNIAPEAIDVYDPKRLLGHVCFHPEVHAALKKLLNWGFVDVFRKHCRQPGHYSFWDYRIPNAVRRNLGWRLDHIMATKPLAEKSITCRIDTAARLAPKPSDHAPVLAEFSL